MKSQQEQEVRARVDEVRDRLDLLSADLRTVDDEVESLAPQREQQELLDQACGSLEKLDELGVSALFWGDRIEPAQVAERLREVRDFVEEFQVQLREIDEQRQTILGNIERENENLEILGEDLWDIRQEEERRKREWIVERDINPLPPREQRMAWARGGEDDRRFHKSLAASMLASLLLGVLLPMIDLPLPKPFVPEDLPRRLAKLVRPELPQPVKTTPLSETADPNEPEPQDPEPVDEPEPTEVPPDAPEVASSAPPSDLPGPPGPESPGMGEAARQEKIGKAGILAFRDKFASLPKDDVTPRLGADARYGNADDSSKALMPTRSMLTTNTPGSSGGINIGALSRNVGGGGQGGAGGGGIQGVQVGKASSGITAIGGGGGGNRPRAGGGGGQAPTRTDEEIQIVFDRYKAAFYRLYNRELRNDPTLRGQMVLRLTIESDGSVSMCKLQSTDMNAPNLATQVVERVRSINFGAKEGVQAMTIIYPIDFLPKA